MCGDIVIPASFWVHLPMEMPLNGGFFGIWVENFGQMAIVSWFITGEWVGIPESDCADGELRLWEL